MATYLNILNSVQRRLRENVSEDVESNEYDTLLGIFIDDAKREYEDTWKWERYKEVISVNTADNDDIMNLGNNTSQRTQIRRGWNTTSADPISSIPMSWILDNQLSSSPTTGSVTGYHWAGGSSTDGSATVHLYLRADGIQTLKWWIYNPPVALSGNAAATFYNGPENVVILGAMLRALAERGDDGGRNYQILSKEYKVAVSDLLGYEQQIYGHFDWCN